MQLVANSATEPNTIAALLFPALPTDTESTVLVLAQVSDRLPVAISVGTAGEVGGDPQGTLAAAGLTGIPGFAPGPFLHPINVPGTAGLVGAALLPEHWTGLSTRPGLRGHRITPPSSTRPGTVTTGGDWSPRFTLNGVDESQSARLLINASDRAAGLELRTELEALPGGALRVRHSVRNAGAGTYVVDGLEVVVPVPDLHDEMLDFTGRHERERTPQRRAITDGLWLREVRKGRTGLDAPMMLVTGKTGFGFSASDVLAVHVGWSGNSLLRLERGGAGVTTVGGGELLLPGEIALAEGDSYTTPWLYVIASTAGLDGISAALHTWQRSLEAHPISAPVTFNVWEAVYFNHDLSLLSEIADRAAAIGVERFVLDDGWFHLRRDDRAGLGDWWIDPAVWPDGLTPLIEHVNSLGMEFGLWFEPEMVNPDSNLYRIHPDWVLSTGNRVPLPERNQLVLDITRPEVWQYLFDQISAILGSNNIAYVKWDHNRELLEAGSASIDGAPAVRRQTIAFYHLVDSLRTAHPHVTFESCASGGGRIDLGVLERVQRVWTSDMTDALSRQEIQRWTVQLLAPEYLGAHISAPVSHQTGRSLSLSFRAATALFGAFGIEWDISQASATELEELSAWVALFKRYRPLLHSGRVIRVASSDPAVLLHGVIAADRSEALLAHVQMDESASNRGVWFRVPGVRADGSYHVAWEDAVDKHSMSVAPPLQPQGPVGDARISGQVLAKQGIWIPRRRPATIQLIHLTLAD
jgi:alpha-galactosidase